MKCQFWYIVSLVVDMEWFVLNCDLTDSLYLETKCLTSSCIFFKQYMYNVTDSKR